MAPITRSVPPRNPRQPTPLLRLKIQDLAHPGAQRFLTHVPVASVLQDAVTHVLDLLYPTSNNWLPTRSVTLILDSFEGVAYTTGKSLDNDHKEIHFSVNYIASISPSTPTRVGDEIVGVIIHEMVHCWQHNGRGTCPGGLIEGVADWLRLKTGYAPPHWKKAVGGNWDQGYQATAYFLEWLEERCGSRSVPRINEALKDTEYQDGGLWRGLFGTTVDALWDDYVRSLREEESRLAKTSLVEQIHGDNTRSTLHINIAGDGAPE